MRMSWKHSHTLFRRILIPPQGIHAILCHTDASPVPISERHLCALVATMRCKRQVQLRFCLVYRDYAVIASRMKEPQYSLRGRVPCSLSMRRMAFVP